MYYLTVQCQHCEKPQCVDVCPTGASQKLEDGTVQIDKEKCIGCQFCVMACPYNVRYLNERERVVEKCTLCEQLVQAGGIPQCVTQCGGMARYFGDIQGGLAALAGANDTTLGAFIEPYQESDVYALPDVGNAPSFRFILRNRTWRG
jgi:Fe-S-cluster-containing dehydrogenase component